MLLNSRENMLYIFAGQRNKEYLSDFYVYDIGSSTAQAPRLDCDRTKT